MAKEYNCKINGKNYYRVSLTTGVKPNGKQSIKWFYGNGKKDALRQKEEYIHTMRFAPNVTLAAQPLGIGIQQWLDTVVEIKNEAGTKERYDIEVRLYIKPSELARLRIGDIGKPAVINFYNELYKTRTNTQVEMTHKILNRFFNYCVNELAISVNPCSRIPLRKDDIIADPDIPVYTKDEIAKIRKQLDKPLERNRIKAIIYTAFSTGAREGEMLALTWNDIDFKNNIININKTLTKPKVNGKRVFKVKPPKTKSSVRKIPMSKLLVPILKAHRILTVREKMMLQDKYTDNNLVFPTATGNYMDATNLRSANERMLKSAGIEVKKFHAYRHTFATQMFEAGADLLTVSRILGHKNTKITEETYTHVLNKRKHSEIEKINDLLA